MEGERRAASKRAFAGVGGRHRFRAAPATCVPTHCRCARLAPGFDHVSNSGRRAQARGVGEARREGRRVANKRNVGPDRPGEKTAQKEKKKNVSSRSRARPCRAHGTSPRVTAHLCASSCQRAAACLAHRPASRSRPQRSHGRRPARRRLVAGRHRGRGECLKEKRVTVACPGGGRVTRGTRWPTHPSTPPQDTVTGFLLAGVGHVDLRRSSNFFIVNDSEFG